MGVFIKVFIESIAQALQQLRANKLRSFLSLLGISIGIFCIIGVTAAVDSLEDNVRGSFEKLGDDVVYIQKFMWGDPGPNWQRYLRRPDVSYKDFQAVSEKVNSAQVISYGVYIGRKTLKFQSSNVSDVDFQAVSYGFDELVKLDFQSGRYFSPTEYHYGANKIIIGSKIAEGLFGANDPIGRTIKMGGHKFDVIGVLAPAGKSLIDIFQYDNSAIISYELGRKVANLRPDNAFGNASISVKAKDGVTIEALKDEITGVLRVQRRLKPREEDNFSLNTLSIISQALDGFFIVLNMLGIVIGGFAIFVGMFSVANIMFVSVKERTGIIGIKKALGAKRFIILLEFLIESIILCLIGGAMGLLLVQIVITGLSKIIDFELFLSSSNIILGVVTSVVVGILAGLIPAWQAARMDPVEAMRK
ncbi:MAG: ABC transporter permease [Saprospiraceae bacterium]|nr:ABC transporter permease [Saprospiraceae bacterium]